MNEICYYDHYKEQLSGSILSKARKFNRLNLVQRLGHEVFAVLPIPNYNVTTYNIKFNAGVYSCDCQSNAIHHKICSHICAVSLYLKTREGVTNAIL